VNGAEKKAILEKDEREKHRLRARGGCPINGSKKNTYGGEKKNGGAITSSTSNQRGRVSWRNAGRFKRQRRG